MFPGFFLAHNETPNVKTWFETGILHIFLVPFIYLFMAVHPNRTLIITNGFSIFGFAQKKKDLDVPAMTHFFFLSFYPAVSPITPLTLDEVQWDYANCLDLKSIVHRCRFIKHWPHIVKTEGALWCIKVHLVNSEIYFLYWSNWVSTDVETELETSMFYLREGNFFFSPHVPD